MPPEAERLAEIHAACFTDAPRPWTAREFARLLPDAAVLLVAEQDGFALGRLAGPEAELLTIAVLPTARGRGLGGRLLAALETGLAGRGVVELFLEVSHVNTPARRLYARAGFAEVGRRPGYYRPAECAPSDALVLRKEIAGKNTLTGSG